MKEDGLTNECEGKAADEAVASAQSDIRPLGAEYRKDLALASNAAGFLRSDLHHYMKSESAVYSDVDPRYLELLSERYGNKAAVFSEIINLKAILQLPKGTEHFVSDLHGADESLRHILNSCSGVIREKVDALFDEYAEEEKAELCTLIYYPTEVLSELDEKGQLTAARYGRILNSLIVLCRYLSAKYTRSKVRKAVNREYAYIIDELINAQEGESNGRALYHAQIIDTIISTRAARDFTVSLCELSKRLAVDHLHVVGDIFDRGPSPDKVMRMLMRYHSIDIQWGNHDILWMGAACGSEVCMATVLRNNIKYGNCEMLESGYGISLRTLDEFAWRAYSADGSGDGKSGGSCKAGRKGKKRKEQSGDRDGRGGGAEQSSLHSEERKRRMDRAISVIALKLQGQLIKRNPNFGMEDRLLLDKADLKAGKIEIDGVTYALNTTDFPTVDAKDPYALSADEREVMRRLAHAFGNSTELREEVEFLLSHGALYKRCNGNLLYHGCVPMTESGDFARVECPDGKKRSGREYFDYCESMVRQSFKRPDASHQDFMYFLWCAFDSPLSGRIMKPFEHAYIDDKAAREEPRNPYYKYYYREETCREILRMFGLDPDRGHIINGHTPIRVVQGESPVRGNGRLLVIDGGMCSAYHKTTGIAGFTLVFSSHGLTLRSHRPFESTKEALRNRSDIDTGISPVEMYATRLKVNDSDTGSGIRRTIFELEALLDAYRQGILPERDGAKT